MRVCENPLGLREDLGNQDGFSLIEVLVTLCVVALLSLAMFGGLSQLARMRTITQSLTAEQELDATLDYLQDLIANSQNLPLLDQGGARASMIGDAKYLRFVAQARTASDHYVLRDVELSLEDEGGSRALNERHSVRRASGGQVEGEFSVIVNVTSFELHYQGGGRDAAQWQDHWNSDQRPQFVSLEIAASRNGADIKLQRLISMR